MWQQRSGSRSQRFGPSCLCCSATVITGGGGSRLSPYRSTSRSRVSYVSRKKRCVSSSTTGISRPSSETMCTSTEDCFCHEQVRQSLSPYSSCAQRSRSSADIASKSSSGSGGAVAKQHLLQRVRAQPTAERLERDHLVRRDVPEVDGRPELLHEPGLRRLRGGLEDQVVGPDVVDDLVYEPGPHLAGRAEDPGRPALASLRDHLPGAGVELLLDPLDPEVGREVHLRVLRADLGEDGEVAGEVGDELEFLLPRHLHGAVRDLDVRQPELAEPAFVLLDLPTCPDRLEERPA